MQREDKQELVTLEDAVDDYEEEIEMSNQSIVIQSKRRNVSPKKG